jgi:hypothetical protein
MYAVALPARPLQRYLVQNLEMRKSTSWDEIAPVRPRAGHDFARPQFLNQNSL